MIRKFKAPNMMEAMRMAKEVFGENAIILQSKKVKEAGLVGDLLGSEMIEITATSEEGLTQKSHPETKAVTPHERSFYSPSTVRKVRPASPENYSQIKAELDGIKEAVADMSGYLRYNKVPILPETMRFLVEEKGIAEEIAAVLLQSILFSVEGHDLKDRAKINSALRREIQNYFRVNTDLSLPKGRPKKICLVGPTGMGKTTSIVKLATHPVLYGQKSVALATIDTYRVAAAAQLKTFAALAQLPLEIVYKHDEFRTALQKFETRDLILIDTAGRSPHNEQHLGELKRFLEIGQPDEIHLVVSATTRIDILLDSVKSFTDLGANRLIISKIDETRKLGTILSFCSKIALPISFLTNGQVVPDDIIIAEKTDVASQIIGS